MFDSSIVSSTVGVGVAGAAVIAALVAGACKVCVLVGLRVTEGMTADLEAVGVTPGVRTAVVKTGVSSAG